MTQITSRAIETMLAQSKGVGAKFIVEAYDLKVRNQFIKAEISDGTRSIRSVIHATSQKLDLCKIGKPYGDKPKYLIQITEFVKFQDESLIIIEILNFIALNPPRQKQNIHSPQNSKSRTKIEEFGQALTQKKQNSLGNKGVNFSHQCTIQRNLQQLTPSQLSNFQIISNLYVDFSRWEIVVRVIEKSYRQFINRNQSLTKIFEMILIDKKGTKIEGVIFGDSAKQFYEKIQQNGVYRMSGGQVRNNKFQKTGEEFSKLNIVFNNRSRFSQVANIQSIPEATTQYTSINRVIEEKDPSMLYSIPCVLLTVASQETIYKYQRELIKKIIVVGDPQSKKSMQVTLWNKQNQQKCPNNLINQTILLRNFKFNQYKGSKYLASSIKSQIICLQQHRFNSIKNRYKPSDYSNVNESQISYVRTEQIKTISDLAKDIQFCTEDTLYTSLQVYLIQIYVRSKWYYEACSNTKCNKAAEADTKCMNCGFFNKQIRKKFAVRIQVADYTGSIYLTAFDQFASQIFKGTNLDRLLKLQQNELQQQAQRRLYDRFRIRVATKKDFEGKLRNNLVGRVQNVQKSTINLQSIRKMLDYVPVKFQFF